LLADMKVDTPFRRWRRRMELTQAEAAEAIGRSQAQVAAYDKEPNEEDLPRIVRIAMLAVEMIPEDVAHV
jgi:transcriptional regulator with XRE-family HTH domain